MMSDYTYYIICARDSIYKYLPFLFTYASPFFTAKGAIVRPSL